MAYDEIDAMHDAAMEAMYQSFAEDPDTRRQFYEELYDDIVKDFTDARLRSFYETQPDLAKASVDALARARALQPHDETAAATFAAVAAEVGLRSTLLTPIVNGLVHTDTAPTLIVRLAITKTDENLMKVLLDLLTAHGGLDLRTYRRNGSATSIWEELRTVQKKRNRIVHQAETASADDTILALAVASCILEELFPSVITRLGFHFHGSTVCQLNHPVKK